MMRFVWQLTLVALFFSLNFHLNAQELTASEKLKFHSVNLTDTPTFSIGEFIEYIREDTKKLTLAQAIKTFKQSAIKSDQQMLNFGINSSPVWLHLIVNNPTNNIITRQIVLENSWLDQAEFFISDFISDNNDFTKITVGDFELFNNRKIDHRFFVIQQNFIPGESNVYIRIESIDPMMLPIYLTTNKQTQQLINKRAYYYGFVYGFLIALFAYNLVLYFSLKDKRYLYYVLYLLAFLFTNFSYTGFAFQWLWPNSPHWQNIAIPSLMILYSLSGLLFAQSFLSTQSNLPKLHRLTTRVSALAIILYLGSIIFSQQALLLFTAFSFTAAFSVIMLILGIASFKIDVKEAKYFLPATAIAMLGVLIVTLAVWGVIPYNKFTYHSIEIGILIESILLALALGEQFRITQQQKIKAEFLSMIDPLTELYNRRGFYQSTQGVFSNAKRQQRSFSILILDLDKFKAINDNYSHAVGDKILQKTAQIIKENVRQGDVPTRWGGEEFIIALPETNLIEALSFAERLRQSIEKVNIIDNNSTINFSTSIGVACLTVDKKSLDELIAHADENLYKAKNSGRNKVVG